MPENNPELPKKPRPVSPINGQPIPNGRPKGVPNKATIYAREAIARFVDRNTQRLEGWLDEIAADNPLAAFNCVRDLLEYHIPKIARTEVVGASGGPLELSVRDVTARVLREIPDERLAELLNDDKN